MSTALLIVDVQRGMFAFPAFQPHNGAALITTINGLIEKARSANAAVIFVRHAGGDGHPLEPGTPGHAIDARLNRQSNDPIVNKSRCVSFRDTELEDTLRHLAVTKLVVCGLQTDHCVDSAIRGAVDRGFEITVAKGAHTTFDTGPLPASKIIDHHESIWSESFGAVVPATDIEFGSEP